MIKLLADENLRNSIVRGIRRRLPEIDIVRVQDVGLSATADPDILAWAAEQDRVLITHDVGTVPGFAWNRVEQGQPMAGVLVVPERTHVGAVLEDLALVADAGRPEDRRDQVTFLPL